MPGERTLGDGGHYKGKEQSAAKCKSTGNCPFTPRKGQPIREIQQGGGESEGWGERLPNFPSGEER